MTNHPDTKFTYVHGSINFCNKALTEIFHISESKETKEEVEMLNNRPFNFYRVSLQYCFNAEYTKLTEARGFQRYPENHISSIFHLNTYIKENSQPDFSPIYNRNLEIINQIMDSLFWEKQNRLRDKKFSHGDIDAINNPLSFKGLTDEEIEIGFQHLTMMYAIINSCLSYLGGGQIDSKVPERDDRTKRFIKSSSVYKKYYFDNYLKARSEGYNLS